MLATALNPVIGYDKASNQSLGKEVMKRLELYARFPEIALFEFRKNCAQIHIEKTRIVSKFSTEKYMVLNPKKLVRAQILQGYPLTHQNHLI